LEQPIREVHCMAEIAAEAAMGMSPGDKNEIAHFAIYFAKWSANCAPNIRRVWHPGKGGGMMDNIVTFPGSSERQPTAAKPAPTATESSPGEILYAFSDVLRAQENVLEFAEKTVSARPSLYRAFAPPRVPRLSTIVSFLDALGLTCSEAAAQNDCAQEIGSPRGRFRRGLFAAASVAPMTSLHALVALEPAFILDMAANIGNAVAMDARLLRALVSKDPSRNERGENDGGCK
jgi:DNA-binding phage protein